MFAIIAKRRDSEGCIGVQTWSSSLCGEKASWDQAHGSLCSPEPTVSSGCLWTGSLAFMLQSPLWYLGL